MINGAIMNIKQLSLVAAVSALTFTTATNAVLGPIPIYLNTEYRTANPVIGSIASTLSFNKNDIQESGANTFGEFLTMLPGVSYEGGQGNLTSVRIRGNEAAHTLLLIDGAKVTITATQPNLDIVPLDSIEKIEILKGPFSSLYGPGAIGGVIAITTNKKQDSKSGSLHLSYGTHGSIKFAINFSNSDEKSYINVSASDYHTDGINAKSDDTTGEKDSVDRRSFSINVGTELSKDTDIEVNLLNTRATIEYDGNEATFPWATIPGGDIPDNNLTQFNIKTTHKFSKKNKLSVDIRRQDTQRRQEKYKLDGLTIIDEMSFDNAILSLGFESEDDKDLKNNAHIKHQDIFAQYQTNLNDNDLVIGLRQVDHKKFSKHLAYNIGWAKNFDDVRLNAAYGKATNLPNHFQNAGNIALSKSELRPEHSKNFEFGIEYKNITAKAFKSKTKDAFKYVYIGGYGGSLGEYYYNNADNGIENEGIEINFKNKLLNWDIDTSLDHLKSIDSVTKLEQGRRPKKSLNVVATNKYGKFNNRVSIIVKSSAWDKDDESGGKIDGYKLLDLRTSYKYNKETSISLNINNALDKDYEVAKGYNMLGRTITLGVTHNF